MTWTPTVRKPFSAEAFAAYVAGLDLRHAAWRPDFIVLHNTGCPNLGQRPSGFSSQHMDNFDHFYRDQQKWSAGPHLFVDDHAIWAYTPLTCRGTHSPSWNAVAWGIEMLGDYNVDDFRSGRGAAVRANTMAAIKVLLGARGWPADKAHLALHHEDPKTTHHDCPGKSVVKTEVLAALSGVR